LAAQHFALHISTSLLVQSQTTMTDKKFYTRHSFIEEMSALALPQSPLLDYLPVCLFEFSSLEVQVTAELSRSF
jgi:hypothetical protein